MYQPQPTEIIPVSAVNRPPVTRQQLLEGMPKAKGGQNKPRLTHGFPMWAFLTINPALAETRGRIRGDIRARGAG